MLTSKFSAIIIFSTTILLTTLLANPDPLFLRGQLGGLFNRNVVPTAAMGAQSRYANSGNMHGHANGAGFVGGSHHGGGAAAGAGYTGGGGASDHHGSGYSGGNRYGDHQGSGHFGGSGHMHGAHGGHAHGGMGHAHGGLGHAHGGVGHAQGAYGHMGGGGSFGHGMSVADGGVQYGGMGQSAAQPLPPPPPPPPPQGPIGLKAGLKTLLFGMRGRMKAAYWAMKKALKAMFYRGELGRDGAGTYGNNYAQNYAYDRSSSTGRRVPETIEYGRTGQTFLRIGWQPQSSYGGWPNWLRILG